MSEVLSGFNEFAQSSINIVNPGTRGTINIALKDNFVEISGTNFGQKTYDINKVNSFGDDTRHFSIKNGMKEYDHDTFSIKLKSSGFNNAVIKIDPRGRGTFYVPTDLDASL